MNRMVVPDLSSRHEQGFTLVELMVGLVLGLIVIGAILTFTVSSIRANSSYVGATKLQQELRNAMSYVVAELKRAGYDDKAINRLANPANPPSPYSTVMVETAATPDPNANPKVRIGSCIVYSYDRPDATVTTSLPSVVTPAEGEVRVLRLASEGGRGVIEVGESTAAGTPACPATTDTAARANYGTYPASCSGAWCPLTDPRVLDVRQLRFRLSTSELASRPPLGMVSRDLEIWIQGRLTGNDQDVVRGLDTTIKVRADCIRADTGIDSCTAVPAI